MTPLGAGDDPRALATAAVALARRWTAAAAAAPPSRDARAGERLRRLLADPRGLEAAVRFVDRVARPDDPGVGARELARLPDAGSLLGGVDRALLAAGRRLAPAAPGVVVPLARRRLRALVGHLVVDADDVGAALAQARAVGVALNLNLLGEAVLGDAEAARRAQRTRALVERPDVEHVSVKVSALAAQISPWDAAGSVERVVDRLRPIFRAAAARARPPLVTLDMEEYRDLDLTIAVLVAALDDPALRGVPAGIALQAYLPDALLAFERVLAAARRRRAQGGERIKVRLVKGANLAVERVEAELHGWTPAPFATKAEVDAAYVRLLDVALRPEVTDALRVGVASHNLPDVALAHLLAARRDVEEALDVEMLRGMAPEQVRAVRADVRSLVLYTPVVEAADFGAAVAYLVRRLEESAGGENFLHALATSAPGDLPEREVERFLRSIDGLAAVGAQPRRAARSRPATGFASASDADPARAGWRRRGLVALAAPPRAAASPVLTDVAGVDAVVAAALEAGRAWRTWGAAARAAVLRAAGDALEARRDDLWTVMAHEAGKTLAEADPEVSEAVDLARYYAERATTLEAVDGARFEPARVTVVTPPWNFPVAIPVGGALAALAAGSAVVLKPAPATPACAEAAAEAVHEALAAAGLPPALLQVVRTDEGAVGRRLVTHPDVDAVVLTGSLETARLFAGWRPEARLLAETSGKNAVVVTPAADLDLAVADVVRSAFGHAGQKCSAASLVIAVGSVATSPRFRRQLVDAVTSVRVGWAEDPGTTLGPLVEPPSGKLLRALTTLEPGESWLVEPRRLDPSGRLWSPGVREGVAPGSFFHVTECFGPVLGLMSARTLEEAVAIQNATPYGLTGGIHSLDEDEVQAWLAGVEVGNAYVNRGITGAVVRRQPFGGWKASVVGPGAKAGGPDYVAQLGTWWPDGEPTRLGEPPAPVLALLEELGPLLRGGRGSGEGGGGDEAAWVRRAAGSDAAAWREELGCDEDPLALAAESNVLRRVPVPALGVRAGEGARWAEVVRLLAAAALVGAPVTISVDPSVAGLLPPVEDPADLLARRRLARFDLRVETAAEAAEAVRRGGGPGRVRLVGASPGLAAAAAAAGVTLVAGPVLAAGRRELLTVLREQAVSRTRHRFGHLPPGSPLPPA